MESSVTAFAYKASNGSLTSLQTISTLSTLRKDYSGVKEAAEIAVHPSGKFLYASNRGTAHNITIFTISAVKGTMKLEGEVVSKRKTPRNFVMDPSGAFLLTANEDSGNIVVFRIDPATGGLTATGQTVEVPAPVGIAFVPAA